VSATDFMTEIEGFEQIQAEIAVLRKYGHDYSLDRGRVTRILNQLHPKRLHLKVSEIRTETPSTKSFRLVSTAGPLPPFLAGQYVNLLVDIGGVRTSRPYSIASPPNQTGFFEIAVRRVPDGFVSNYLLDEVRVGDEFRATSPGGHFHFNPLVHTPDLVLLAGGSGITPFMSMVREATDRGLDRRLHLIYGSRNPDDVIFREELMDRAARHDNFRFDLIVSEPPAGYQGLTGLITAESISEIVGEVTGKTFLICGPEAMYNFCLPELKRLGLTPGRRLRTEVFGPPARVTAQPGWPEGVQADDMFTVRVRGGASFQAAAGEPLLNSLERNGFGVEAQCRSGECSLCRTKLLAGRVFQPPQVKLRKSDRTSGYIHPCLSYPIEDLEILI
jgi:ferredoxin-NADP reductase